jgi:putative Ig domain-containing protein
MPIDVAGTRLDVGPAAGNTSAFPSSLAFDGSNWLATFLSGGWIFAARMDAGGARLDDELIGLLVNQEQTVRGPALAATDTHALVTWHAASTVEGPGPLVVQRVLAHPTVPAIPDAAIGAIGDRAGVEGQALAFTVSAPALDPESAVFGANLPAGAVFDAATRTFRWVPAADQSGAYPGVHFEASDGMQTVSEDVTLTVAEAIHSVGGTVRHTDLSPAPVILMRLNGAKGGRRTVFTDAAGRYRFDDLPSKSYRVRLDSTSGRSWAATPTSARSVVASADLRGVDFVITPR